MTTLSGAFHNALNRPVDSIRTSAALVLAGAEVATQFPKIQTALNLFSFLRNIPFAGTLPYQTLAKYSLAITIFEQGRNAINLKHKQTIAFALAGCLNAVQFFASQAKGSTGLPTDTNKYAKMAWSLLTIYEALPTIQKTFDLVLGSLQGNYKPLTQEVRKNWIPLVQTLAFVTAEGLSYANSSFNIKYPKVEATARATAFVMTAIGIAMDKANTMTTFARNSV
jgi:hypothetical protein